ncbi:hydroxymethylglutaryl-CoA lyase [Limnohabitans sp. Rim8]|uniref:hydroxymethylglutaryl-CoA lyase n=1 Tax=Limnohabitans sp. Rim8 TaxID=1100718 RepID=UPI0033063FE9
MTSLPKFVEFHEEGPREGFQFEKTLFPLEKRLALIDALAQTGVSQIQVASFVHPKVVPQMADTEELFARLKPRPGIAYTGLWLNERGFERALKVPNITLQGGLNFYASDAFSRMNNNRSAIEVRDAQRAWVLLYADAGVPLETAHIMTAFGCNLEGAIATSKVTSLVRWIADLCHDLDIKLPKIYLCDTVGWAAPNTIRRMVDAVREIVPEARIGLHLHDTRGLGAANFFAALEMGIDLFDSSVAGLGGCPFCGHSSAAAGNICTEDMVFMCHELGIETGINLEALIEAAQLAESIFGKTLTGHVMHAGSLKNFRNAKQLAAV